MIKKISTLLFTFSFFSSFLFSANDKLSEQNTLRAISLVDSAFAHHFKENSMARYFNPYTNKVSDEKASVWMYTSSIEAVNAILHTLKSQKENGNNKLYKKYFKHYTKLLDNLYEDLDFYAGTFTLTSYTQTKEWTVYGVDRGSEKGKARVEGIYNVYDDQQWLVRELIESYKLTGNKKYLTKAEYLTQYILDGWDCTLDKNGNENGGITWGPGYTTKHACSNGPMISPLVWLHELYKGKNDKISYLYIESDQNRKSAELKKSDYYLTFAKKIYDWQRKHLLRNDGVFHDMLGGCDPDCSVAYETINGIKYRKHTRLTDAGGKAHTYNSGSIISGAADLHRATKNNIYLEEAKEMSRSSFDYFAKLDKTIPQHFSFPIDGFSNWFNGVLMRSYFDVYPAWGEAGKYIESFQQNLDYGYDKFLYRGVLPSDLLMGWNTPDKRENKTEGMFSFTFAAEYAILARFQLDK